MSKENGPNGMPDFFEMFKGRAPKPETTKATTPETDEFKAEEELYEAIRKHKPSTLLAVLEIIATSECWFVDALLEVVRGAHHASHRSHNQEKEAEGLIRLLKAMKEAERNDTGRG